MTYKDRISLSNIIRSVLQSIGDESHRQTVLSVLREGLMHVDSNQ